MNLISLPPELLDQIVSDLTSRPPELEQGAGDMKRVKQDLCALSLSCTSFRYIAQKYLFQDLTFRFRSAPATQRWYDSHGDLTLTYNPAWESEWPTYPYETLTMLISFLSLHIHCSRAVKRLKLVAFPWNEGHITSQPIPSSRAGPSQGTPVIFFDDTSYADTETFVSLISSLSNLQELELVDVLVKRAPGFWAQYTDPLPALKRLSVSYKNLIHSTRNVGNILGCFSAVKTVALSHLPFSLQETEECTAPRQIRITSFRCQDETPVVETALDYLLHASQTLQSLDVGLSAARHPTFHAVLNSAAPYLKHFGYTVSIPWYLNCRLSTPNLSDCVDLRSLTLRCCFPPHIAQPDTMDTHDLEACSRLMDVLLSCRSCSLLDTVAIELISTPNLVMLGDFMRAILDKGLLELQESTSLKTVVFTRSHYNPAEAAGFTEEDQDWIRENLPRVREHYRLRFGV